MLELFIFGVLKLCCMFGVDVCVATDIGMYRNNYDDMIFQSQMIHHKLENQFNGKTFFIRVSHKN